MIVGLDIKEIQESALVVALLLFQRCESLLFDVERTPAYTLVLRCVVWWGTESVRIPIVKASEIHTEIVLGCLDHLVSILIRRTKRRSSLKGGMNLLHVSFCVHSSPSLSGIQVSAP
jgi:hypothetical protein